MQRQAQDLLLKQAKEKLRITWEEENEKVQRLVHAAIVDINKLGKVFNYEPESPAKTLMLEHVFYNYNNALHEFYRAYAPELMALALDIATGVHDAP